jgi:hypothetical protein
MPSSVSLQWIVEQRSREREHLASVNRVIQSIDVANVLSFIHNRGCLANVAGSLDIASNLSHEGKQVVYLKLCSKLCSKLKQRIALVADAAAYQELHILLHGENGALQQFCNHTCNCLSQDAVSTRANVLLQVVPSMAKKQKAFFVRPKTGGCEPRVDSGARQTHGFLYLIRTRASINAVETVYKVGKTTQTVEKRLAGYDKGCEIILVRPMPIDLLHEAEAAAISQLREEFRLREDYGREYFEGDCFLMANRIGAIHIKEK